MGWLQKLFGKEETTSTPANDTKENSKPSRYDFLPGLTSSIRLGRYTDYHKSPEQIRSWQLAETKYGDKQYADAIFAFLDFLSDPDEQNLSCRAEDGGFRFQLIQGSREITGIYDGKCIRAYTPIAQMSQPGTAVMRKLLELNYSLYYSHSALSKAGKLKMIFSSPVSAAHPARLYFGLKELATKSDQVDDLLLSEFDILEPIPPTHIQLLPEKELEIRYQFFQRWLEETLTQVNALNPDIFSGAIAYLLLSLIYRIDFLLTPEGKLLASLEQIHTLYWQQEEGVGIAERNQRMLEAVRALQEISQEEFSACMFRTKYTFSIAQPPDSAKMAEYVTAAINDAQWYMANGYAEIAPYICEYCLLYCQFVYSLHPVQTDLILIFMATIHPGFFQSFGMTKPFFNTAIHALDKTDIIIAIDSVIQKHQHRHPELTWDHTQVSYQNLPEFCISFSAQLASLNLDVAKDLTT